MFQFRRLSATLLMTIACGLAQAEPSSDNIAYFVNHANTTWKAASDSGRSAASSQYFLGVLPDPSDLNLDPEWDEVSRSAIPDEFDARTAWPNCPTISYIRNQASCGSCWAFAAAEVISDRICIASRGEVNVHISAEDILSCCKRCGSGCNGGSTIAALVYFRERGTVTGGPYNSRQGCRPYSLTSCYLSDDDVCINGRHPTPSCKKSCIPQYWKAYHGDKYYGKSVYHIKTDEAVIRTNIMRRGPVAASFTVYHDFYYYQTGVYQHVTGDFSGRHAIKIFGWGVENGTPYWLAANSWGTGWGDRGFFKILRGSSECEIEDWMVAGEFKL